jgi:chemotaxis protein methyltransferase CheR
MLVKYFKKDGANWRIADSLRAMASFREWNLLGDLRPLGTFDLVFCRNVLIYFDQPTKAKALEAIAKQMAPDGLLFLGGAETVLGVTEKFAPLQGDRGVYTLAGAAAPASASAPRTLAGAAQR